VSQQGSQRPADGDDGDLGSQPESHNDDDRALATQASDVLRTALQAWRADVQGVSQIGADLQDELAALRSDLVFEEVPLAAASERLERAGVRLAGQLERLRRGEATAVEAVRAVLRAFSAAKDQLNKERAVLEQLPAAQQSGPSATTELLDEIRQEISALSERLEAPLSGALTELVGVVREGLDTVNRSLRGWPDGLARIGDMLGGVRAEVEAAVKQLERSEATAGEVGGRMDAFRQHLTTVGRQLDAVREGMPQAVAEQVSAVEQRMAEAVGELREQQRAISERVERSGEVVQKGMDEVIEDAARIHASLDRRMEAFLESVRNRE